MRREEAARNTGTFGVELEFSLVNEDLTPALNSSYSILHAWQRSGSMAPVCHELASFQIETNPGPWPLDRTGIATALGELQEIVSALREIAGDYRLTLDCSPFVPRISAADLQSPLFFTRKPKFLASARYFEQRSALLEWKNGNTLRLAGDRVIGCINEIHIHVQQPTDAETIDFFNCLNSLGAQTCAPFEQPITVNEAPLSERCTTTRLFEEANGEWNRDHSIRRVGFLASAVQSFAEYAAIIDSFAPIPVPAADGMPLVLDPFSSVYLWVRLRGEPGELRVEFRPMEMSENWKDRVCYLADLALTFRQAHRIAPIAVTFGMAADADVSWRPAPRGVDTGDCYKCGRAR